MSKSVLSVLLIVCAMLLVIPARAQDEAAITLAVEAGFDGYFRDAVWMPVIVHADNSGEDVSGRLVVRPETSGSAITNTYSTPVMLARGAQQTATLYITARALAQQLRVELIDDEGTVIAAAEANIRSIQPQDRLHVVISESALGAVDLSAIHSSNFNGYQAEWAVTDLPDRVAALDAIDLILISDADTGALTARQTSALRDWVASGGHLIVTGGANWQATAAGLTDLLPLNPTGSEVTAGLEPLAAWLRLEEADLAGDTVIATGDLHPDAVTLVAGDAPLIIRRSFGGGVVDYLSANPTDAPLRGWNGMSDLWFTLATTTRPQPGWANGFIDWEQASRAAEILPGYDPLPDILPLCGFLTLYIALIGPVNYVVLTRINRREWAWVTIPLCIILFSVMAWTLGSSLRGNDAQLNRIALVQSWQDSARARVDGLVGLLSPRRTQYTLIGGDTLRPIPRPAQTALLGGGAQNSVNISQRDGFEADDFTVDASFVAGFNLTTTIDKPPIDGSATIAYDRIDGQQTVRGSVRNDSDQTLTDPVILARGVVYRFEEPLAPGEVKPFELTLPGEGIPAPALQTTAVPTSGFNLRSAAVVNKQSAIDILGTDNFITNFTRLQLSTTLAEQTQRRRQFFLSSFISDASGTAGRADRVFLAGWADTAPFEMELSGSSWNAQDIALYLVELETTIDKPAGEVTITPDQFTWVVRDYFGMGDTTPVGLTMQPGEEIIFQYTPLPEAVLDRVDTLSIHADDVNIGGRRIPVQVWDWAAQEWEPIDILNELALIREPERFLGAQNAVRLRFLSDDAGGYLRIGRITVSQTGSFS